MGIRESTARTRELGDELRRRRKAANLMGHELAKKLQWSANKVSRIELGQRAADEVDVVWYLAQCGVQKHELDEVLELCRNANPGFWMKERLRSLIFHETTASGMHSYEPLVMPGLLQTEDYARALIGRESIGPMDIARAVDVRMRRQQILEDEWRPPQFTFYVHEQVLRLPVGGNRVMNEQLLHMLFLATRPNLVIRVVPASLGARSYFGSAFVLFEYGLYRPLVYLENGVSGLFVEDVEYVYRYQRQLAKIAGYAADDGQSRVLLAAVASEYDRLDVDQGDTPDHLAEEQLQR